MHRDCLRSSPAKRRVPSSSGGHGMAAFTTSLRLAIGKKRRAFSTSATIGSLFLKTLKIPIRQIKVFRALGQSPSAADSISPMGRQRNPRPVQLNGGYATVAMTIGPTPNSPTQFPPAGRAHSTASPPQPSRCPAIVAHHPSVSRKTDLAPRRTLPQ